MQHTSTQEPGQNFEMSLREHLLAAEASGSGPAPYPTSSAAPQPPPENPYQPSDSASPREQYDHSGGHQQYGMSGDSAGDDGLSPDARKAGKRELSTSKRAAQNRAAQRAFRQRKEGYIKKLEEEVKEFKTMEQNFRALQSENYQLREYILSLQSRLLENQSDFPPAPSHVILAPTAHSHRSDGEQPATGGEHQMRRDREAERLQRDGMSQLQAAAAQASEAASAQESPYGLGGKRQRTEAGADFKPVT